MKTFLEWMGGEVFGWLSPSGKLYPCGRFGHAELAMNTPDLKRHISQETLDEVEEAKMAAARGYDQDESMKEDAEAEISMDLYRSGFLRIGSWGFDITFEGTPKAIKNLYQKAKDIAEERGGKAVFEPMDV